LGVTGHSLAEAAARRLDVRVAVDASGDAASSSIARATLDALAERLPAGALAGVWVGGAKLEPLAPYRAVDDDWRRLVRVVSSSLKSSDSTPDLRTALEQIAWDADVGQSRRDLVWIAPATHPSAGPADASGRRALIESVLPRLTRAGFRVHVITAPTSDDAPFLRQLASATGGDASIVENADEARAWVDQALASDATAGAADGSFVIDGARDEVTIVAAHHAHHLKLVSPAEQTIDASVVSAFVRWFEQEERTVVTLSGPAPGRWRFEPAPERVLVLDDLQLHVSPDVADGRVVGLVASLTNEDRVIEDRLLDGLVIVQAGREADGPEALLRVHLPGSATQRYGIDLGAPTLAPDDRIRVQALGRTFEREVEFTLASSAPIRVGVTAGSAGEAVMDVRVLAAGVVGNSLRVLGSLQFGDGRSTVVAGLRQADGAWRLRAPPLGSHVDVVFRIDGNYLNNKDFSISTEPLEIELPLAHGFTADFAVDGRSVGDRPRRDPAHAPAADTAAPAAQNGAAAPSDTPHDAAPPRDAPAPTEVHATRKLSRIEAIAAGVVVGINVLALLVLGVRVSLPRPREGADETRQAKLDGALAQYREALAAAASRLGQLAR